MGVELRENANENRAGYRRKYDGRRSPVRIDYRKRVGKRARELSRHFAAALTAAGRELSIELTVAIGKAAELVALAEDLRARMLRADPGANADDMVRMQRLADLSVRRLALPSAASKSTPTLGDLLKADHERQMGRVP
jgi:hypothetical protein